MLKMYDLYCKDDDWNKEFTNPNRNGFANEFELKTIRDDKIVIDIGSGLMWQQNGSLGDMKYEAAKKWIADINQKVYAGYHDWCLPTLEEAKSLMMPKEMNHDLYIDPKFDSTQQCIWICDLFQGAARQWVVLFYNAFCSYYPLFDEDGYVQAVRFE